MEESLAGMEEESVADMLVDYGPTEMDITVCVTVPFYSFINRSKHLQRY